MEIGWYLHPDSEGHGFASEAAEALLTHVLHAPIDRVWAVMWPQNEASARVAASIGMADQGVINDPFYGSEEEPTSRVFVAERTSGRGSDAISHFNVAAR